MKRFEMDKFCSLTKCSASLPSTQCDTHLDAHFEWMCHRKVWDVHVLLVDEMLCVAAKESGGACHQVLVRQNHTLHTQSRVTSKLSRMRPGSKAFITACILTLKKIDETTGYEDIAKTGHRASSWHTSSASASMLYLLRNRHVFVTSVQNNEAESWPRHTNTSRRKLTKTHDSCIHFRAATDSAGISELQHWIHHDGADCETPLSPPAVATGPTCVFNQHKHIRPAHEITLTWFFRIKTMRLCQWIDTQRQYRLSSLPWDRRWFRSCT